MTNLAILFNLFIHQSNINTNNFIIISYDNNQSLDDLVVFNIDIIDMPIT